MAAIASRSYLSLTHLLCADTFVNELIKLELTLDITEKRIIGIEYSNEYYIKHRALVIGALYSSIAFLEATINEIFQDSFETKSGYISSFSSKEREEMVIFWKEKQRRANMLDKYSELMRIMKDKPLNKGMEPIQSLKTILEIRNQMTHYVPNWVSHTEQHKYERLKGEFLLNKLSVESDPFFPNQLLGAGFAQWVLSKCKEFADNFFKEIKIEPAYQSLKLISV